MAERISVGCGEAVSRASLRNFQITLPHHQVRKAQPDDRETHHGVSVTLVCSAVPLAEPYALNGCRLLDRLWRIFCGVGTAAHTLRYSMLCDLRCVLA